jgi:hypothetical protein
MMIKKVMSGCFQANKWETRREERTEVREKKNGGSPGRNEGQHNPENRQQKAGKRWSVYKHRNMESVCSGF